MLVDRLSSCDWSLSTKTTSRRLSTMRLRLKKTVINTFMALCGFVVGWMISRSGWGFAPGLYWSPEGQTDPPSLKSTVPDDGGKDPVMIGVMTTRDHLLTRAAAIHATWGRHVNGKLVFYIGQRIDSEGDGQQSSTEAVNRTEPVQMVHNLPVVQLTNISDTVYPPRLKSSAMLSHMFHNFGRHFRWFVRADDDVFIRYEQLVKLLNSLDSDQLWYVGRSGYGRPDKKGRLGLLYGSPYCMGGPGVVFSSLALRRLVPHLNSCARTAVSSHEDTELGRCVQRHLHMSCVRSYRIRGVFYQNYEDNGFMGSLTNSAMSAITLHPLKDPRLMFKIYAQFLIGQIHSLHDRQRKLVLQLKMMSENDTGQDDVGKEEGSTEDAGKQSLNNDSNKDDEGITVDGGGNAESQRQNTVVDVPNWAWGPGVSRKFSSIYTITPANIRSWKKALMTFLEYARGTGAVKKKGDILGKYQSFAVNCGFQHRIVVSKEKGTQSFLLTTRLGDLAWQEVDIDLEHHTVSESGQMSDKDINKRPNRRRESEAESRHLSHSVSPVLFHKDRTVSMSPPGMSISSWPQLHILMPVYGRYQNYLQFLDHLSQAVKHYPARVHLQVALYPDTLKEHSLTMKASKQPRPFEITIYHMSFPFSRAVTFQTLSETFGDEAVLVFIDVDMVITGDFLCRVAINVKPGTAYFPILFSKYSPQTACYGITQCRHRMFDFSQNSGLWRSFGYGMVALTAGDFRKAGGMNTKIRGWGREDVDFFQRCVSHGIEVFRAADVGMIHKYHDKVCDPKLPTTQLMMCYSSKTAMYGSQAAMGQIVLDMQRNMTKSSPVS